MSETLNFDGRVAIVTGAGAGLGRAYALELAKRGARIVVNDLGGARDGTGGSSAAADAVVDEIKALGGEAVPNYDSVAEIQGGENITKAALDAFGTVDIVINNAGILRDKSFLKMEPDNWDAVVAVHLTGAYYVTRPAFRVMREKGYGRIILTTSSAGLFGNFGQTNYSAAKMGLIGMMNTLKLEGSKYDIKTNCVAPNAASRLTEDVMPPEIFERMKPEFVTPLVVYLSSQQCLETGCIYNAGPGLYSRTQVLNGKPVKIGDGITIPSAEEVVARMDDINNMDNSEYYQSIPDFLNKFMG